ncbi:Nuclear transcription factor Y subunit C-1 [Apostasia shenzhenica]|uniref:Nuclear transcription factor Y subunit C-1 n=1 Tax=Apostasia shenzhenica TaxID=1088818 RepID=A0A2I0ACG5_9ASPA|nr:Nuclear transcription factor Y subunit C-1 [Apostasia shenzhenica]
MRRPGIYSGVFTGGDASGMKGQHALPLTRIKKIMKRSGGQADQGKMMISVEAPIVFSKVCELFIEELTRRSWASAAAYGKRRTLVREDVAAAVEATDNFDFLVSVVSSSRRAAAGRSADDDSDGVVMDV